MTKVRITIAALLTMWAIIYFAGAIGFSNQYNQQIQSYWNLSVKASTLRFQ